MSSIRHFDPTGLVRRAVHCVIAEAWAYEHQLRHPRKNRYPGIRHDACGGLIPGRLYLLDGDPGAGKTTFALQYLLEGVSRGEKCLYVTLSETREELGRGRAPMGGR